MLLFITARGHSYTVGSLIQNQFGLDVPVCQVKSYDSILRSSSTTQAVHVFTDFERLYPWELRLAAQLYRSLRAEGVPCLNDPARVLARYELLRGLHKAGINPFTAYRAEDHPEPARFPVFVRNETDHGVPVSGLLANQDELNVHLARLRADGIPLRGLLVVEYVGEEVAPNAWRKIGTFRVGSTTFVAQFVHEDRWTVKYGKIGVATEAMYEEEQAAVMSNRFASEIAPAFEVAGVEWGRADHGSYCGRQVVYEINTNPSVGTVRKNSFTDPRPDRSLRV